MFDCAFKPTRGVAVDPLHGPRQDDGRGAAVHLRARSRKTVNVPKDATVEEIEQAYIDSWRIGAKAVSIYRDGSKRTQPLNTSKDKETAPRPSRGRRRPAAPPHGCPTSAQSITHKFDIAGHEGYITVGLYEDGHAGRAVPDDGEGRLDDLGLRRRVRAGDQLRAAVRRAAAGPGGQVQPRPLRAVGDDARTRTSASRSRSSTTSSAGWRRSSCRRRRSSAPA